MKKTKFYTDEVINEVMIEKIKECNLEEIYQDWFIELIKHNYNEAKKVQDIIKNLNQQIIDERTMSKFKVERLKEKYKDYINEKKEYEKNLNKAKELSDELSKMLRTIFQKNEDYDNFIREINKSLDDYSHNKMS